MQVIVTNKMTREFSAPTEFALDPIAQASALDEWTKSHSGPLSRLHTNNAVVFGKDDTVLNSDAFKALDEETRNFINSPGVPHFEIISVCSSHQGNCTS